MPSVFLSHSWKDKFFARKLAETLSSYGVRVWIDEAELRVGDSLIEKIGSAIDLADFVGVVLSHTSVKSAWVQKELAIAMNKEIAGKRIVVLPILMEPCEVPAFLADKLYADFTDPEDFEGPLSRVLHAIGVAKPTQPPAPSAPPETGPKEPPVPPEAETTLEGFEDISIVGVDKSKAYRPDPEKALYHIYFGLSSYPPQEWVQIFEAERQFPRHTMWRHAWVESNYVVMHCVPEEVKKYHLKDIKEDVTNSNQKYREYLRRVAAAKALEVQRERKTQEELDAALDNLEFDT